MSKRRNDRSASKGARSQPSSRLVSRRALLASSAALAAATTVGVQPLVVLAGGNGNKPKRTSSQSLELDAALELVGDEFRVLDGDCGVLQLFDVLAFEPVSRKSVPKGVRTQPFSMLFQILSGDFPAGATRNISHPDLGSFEMFLHPIGPESGLVEAIYA